MHHMSADLCDQRLLIAIQPAKFIHRQKQSTSQHPAIRSISSFTRINASEKIGHTRAQGRELAAQLRPWA
jgi:hypothetical protein